MSEFDEIILCSDCNQPETGVKWCRSCNSKRFRQDFSKWTSGNNFVDKFIQDAQSKARNHLEVIEWIPYNRLRNIQYLAKGGFSIIYKAVLLDGFINKWDKENKQWERYYNEIKDEDYEDAKKGNIESPLNENEKHGYNIVLKRINNSSNINDDFLNELKNYLNFVRSTDNNKLLSIKLHGITRVPESDYMIVMEHMELGSLKSNLMVKRCNPIDKYYNLYFIAQSLSKLHNCNLIHGDLHSGNLLLSNNLIAYISDFGLSKPVDKPTKPNVIYGVLPYIAPEVLRGRPYTKAADIYSFGIIMWEMTSGIPAFNKMPHDLDLALKICQGLRPELVEVPKIFDAKNVQKKYEDTEAEYIELMKKCWDSNPDKRPKAEKLYENFRKWFGIIPNTSIPENETFIENHPSSCYTSRKIDYAEKLNEILDQEENLAVGFSN
ncbi:uncharacterized protein OCT59_005843 [Rhizophagus irregularis]|uniref:uncharacterized protein n=1 Tax=Rhizophagus irregularis TaxID=588596 RepID=UPI0033208BE8|nr:hypothetical protein OCT59_005843 [Rhizophagus irregularis]